jgi:Mg-chelatase subunit ChlD/prenyltransferase beta subunit
MRSLWLLFVLMISALPSVNAADVGDAINAGVNWIVANQNPDGSWGRSFDALSTAFATVALENLGYNLSEERHLLITRANSTKELALAYFATGDAALRDALLQSQSDDGSWGGVATTSLVLIALAEQNYSGTEIDGAVAYLLAQQSSDGGFGSVKDTALAALALSRAGANASAVEKALSWLEARQQSEGSFGYTTDTALASLVLSLSPEHVNASISAVEYLKGVQNRDGGWGIEEGAESRVYPSAVAMLAISLYNQSAPEVAKGASYLLAASHPLGGWSGAPGEGSIVDTAIAIDTLRQLNYSGEALTRAVEWLSQQKAELTDELAWKVIALEGYENVSALAEQLAERQNGDGGWGIKPGYESSLLDTAFAVEAFLRSGYEEHAERSISFLERGCESGKQSIFVTSVGTLALRSYSLARNSLPSEALMESGKWLLSAQREYGGWGELYSTPLDTSAALSALLVSAYAPNATEKAAYLISTQHPDGGWGDVISTAFALRALSYYNISSKGRITNVSVFEVSEDGLILATSFKPSSLMKVVVNHTSAEGKLYGYMANLTFAFNGTSALLRVPSLPPGTYPVTVVLYDSDSGVIQDEESINISVLPTAEILEGTAVISPFYVEVGGEANVTLELRLRLRANIPANLSASYALYSPRGVLLFSYVLNTTIPPQPVLTLPLGTVERNFSDAGVYLIEVNVTLNASHKSFRSYFYVLPPVKLTAEKSVSPEELLPGNATVNLTISLRGEGLAPNVTRKVEAMLVIDRSGSMAFTDYPPTRLAAAVNASKLFAGELLKLNGSRVGVVSFTGHKCTDWFFGCWAWRWDITLDVPLTNNLTLIKNRLDSLRAGGPTAIGMGIYKAREHLAQAGDLTAEKYIIFLSDGKDSGRWCHWLSGCAWVGSPPEHFPLLEAERAKNESIVIYTIGIGDRSSGEFDEELQMQIANITGGKYFYAPTPENLNEIYREIAGEIREAVAGREIVVRDLLPAGVEPLQFSSPPGNITTSENGTIVEWHIPKVGIGEELNLSFQAILRNLTPGERVVNQQVNITYTNVNGDVISFLIPEVTVRVLPSKFELDVVTDKASYRYGENVSIVMAVRNAGETNESALLYVGIYDSQLSPVHLFAPANLSIATNESIAVNLSWNTSQAMAGSYVVVASAQNLSASAGFTILPELNLRTELYSAKRAYTTGETAELYATLRSLSHNYVFENLLASLSIIGENGTAYAENRTIAVLLPGASTTLGYLWSTSNASPGNYTAVLEVYHNASMLSMSNASFSLLAPPLGGAKIEGELNVTPRELRGYSEVNFSYLATNTGSMPLDNLTLVVSLVSPSRQSMVLNLSANASLAVNESINGTFTELIALPSEDYLVLFYAVLNSSIIPLDQSYLRVLATPRTLKNDSIAMLSEITSEEKRAQKEILSAIKHIARSLGIEEEHGHSGGEKHKDSEESLWLDDYNIDSKHGHKVFDEEKKAVKHLLRACFQEERHGKHGKGHKDEEDEKERLAFSCTFNETVEKVIFNLLLADELLANTSITEAELALANATDREKVQREIDKAYEELGRAYNAIAERRYAKAVDHFRLAWEHAQHAIKHAEEEREHEKKEHEEGKEHGKH